MVTERKIAETNPEWSFRKGWMQMRQKDVQESRQKLMEAMGVTTGVSFLNRMSGKIEPRMSEYETITMIFQEYGITDVWGE